METRPPLLCGEDEDLFLFVTPPRSILHDSRTHRTIQCQRTICPQRFGQHKTQTDRNGGAAGQQAQEQQPAPVRIRPVLNLEAHKRAYTRIVELEQDDQRIADLIPNRQPEPILDNLHDASHNSQATAANEPGRAASPVKRRRSRQKSIGERRGAFGGQVASTPAFAGRFDAQVSGSVHEGRLVFKSARKTLTWQRRLVKDHAEWVLQPSESAAGVLEQQRQTLAQSLAADAHAETGMHTLTTSMTAGTYRPHRTLSRANSTASQFTFILDDESVVSATVSATGSPLMNKKETVLSAFPVPHLRHHVGLDRTHEPSMHAIADKCDDEIVLLVSALWIIWASNDILALDEHGVSLEKEPHHAHALATATAAAVSGQPRAQIPSGTARATSFSLSDEVVSPVGKPRERQKKKRNIWQRIARLCSS